MTEFQFFEELEAYQKNFEKLNYIFIRDMHKYIRKSTVYDSTFFKTIVIFSANITLTAAWIKLYSWLIRGDYKAAFFNLHINDFIW